MTKHPRPHRQIVTARITALLEPVLVLPQLREQHDEFSALVSEYLPENGPSTDEDASAEVHALYERIEAALPATQRTLIGEYSDASGQLALAETMAAFDLGRRIEAALVSPSRRPVLDRLFDQLQAQIAAEPEDRGNVRGDMTAVRRALLTARAIPITGDALHCASAGPIDAYMNSERQRVLANATEDETDPGHECLIAATDENSVYYVALTLGLLLSEVV